MVVFIDKLEINTTLNFGKIKILLIIVEYFCKNYFYSFNLGLTIFYAIGVLSLL